MSWNASPTSDSDRAPPLKLMQIEVEYLQEDIVGERADSDSCERFSLRLVRIGLTQQSSWRDLRGYPVITHRDAPRHTPLFVDFFVDM